MVQWNVRGWGSEDASVRHLKAASRETLIFDIEQDILGLQEVRVHYLPQDENATAFAAFKPRALDNYKAIGDPLLKTVLYIHLRHS